MAEENTSEAGQAIDIDNVTRRSSDDFDYKKSLFQYPEEYSTYKRVAINLFINIAVVGYFAWATFYYIIQSLLPHQKFYFII